MEVISEHKVALGQTLVAGKDSDVRGSQLQAWLVAFGASAVGTWLVYHVQFSSGFDLFPGPKGDTRLTAYLLEHWYQVLSGHGELLSPGMFYPVKGAMAFSDIYLVYVPVYALFRLSGYDIFLALGLAVVVLNFLNLFCCFFLLKKVLRLGLLASCAGAFFFAFSNPKLAQADHLQLQPVFLLPIIASLVVLFFLKGNHLSKWQAFLLLGLAAIFLNVQLFTSFYLGWFLILWFTLMMFLSLAYRPSRMLIVDRIRRQALAVIGGTSVFLLGFGCFLAVYLPAAKYLGGYGLLYSYIPDVRSFLLMADGNYVWNDVTALILNAAAQGPDWGRRVGVGLVPSITWLVMSVLGILMIKRHANAKSLTNSCIADWGEAGYVFFALMIVTTNLFYILGLQYRGHTLWHYVYLLFPGATSIRAVARYVIVLSLPIAIAMAFTVQWGVEGVRARGRGSARLSLAIALLAITIFGLFEQFNNGNGQNYSISAENARLQKLAARLPEDCSAFYVAAAAPASNSQADFGDQNYMHDAMLISVTRHVPTLNGRSGKNPPEWFLRNVRAPEYEENVRQWIKRHNISGNVCRLEIDD